MFRTAVTDAADDRQGATTAVRQAAPDAEDQKAKNRRREHIPGFDLDCGTGPEVPHVGIVFVHGIGSQEPGETLLDWGGAIISLLLDVRVAQQSAGDPVIDCELDPAPTKSRYVELQLPAALAKDGTKIPEQHWVMTEAWWAQRVRPPAFGQMAEWLGPRGAISRIVMALLPRRRDEHDPRLRDAAAEYPLRRDPAKNRAEEAAEHGHVAGQKDPGSFQGALREVARVSARLYLQAISTLVLVAYGALRSIEKLLPIGPLKNGALTRPIDRFMLDWFGDVYVLLADPAQSASVRGRLVDALKDLHAADCKSVVVVAHSGGAIVSYMTLADPANEGLRVDRLITLGEGINLAWRINAGPDNVADPDTKRRYERLYEDVFDGRPDLSWHDFWASQDPAPVGVLSVPSDGAVDDKNLHRITSHAIWNRLSFSEDHGGYWENDEEFLLPMVRLLDGSDGATRFFGTKEDDEHRSNRRRRRLSVLSVCRQLALVAPMTAIVLALPHDQNFVWRTSDVVASVWGHLPGADIISGPLNELRALPIWKGNLRFFSEAGVWIIATLIAAVALFALLAPPERPIPWADGRRNLVSRAIRLLPWIISVPVLAAVYVSATNFVRGSTPDAQQVGIIILAVGAEVVVLSLFVEVMFGARSAPDPHRPFARVLDFGEMLLTIVVMVVAAFFALTPFVSAIAFEEVGRTVLGSLAVYAAFQILLRIGMWRWKVWDGRERLAARVNQPYSSVLRVVIQLGLLLATLGCLFVAVATNNELLAGVAAIGVVVSVLLGVSVDVFNAARQVRTRPTDVALRSGVYKA